MAFLLLSNDIGELLRRPHDVVVDVCGDPSTAKQAIEASLFFRGHRRRVDRRV